jgi:hypothetical protein
MTTDAFEMAVVHRLSAARSGYAGMHGRRAPAFLVGMPAPQRLLVRLFARRAAAGYHARLGL